MFGRKRRSLREPVGDGQDAVEDPGDELTEDELTEDERAEGERAEGAGFVAAIGDLAGNEALSGDAEPGGGGAIGPYDLADEPADDIGRADLGGLRVPVADGLEVRLDVDEQSQAVVAAHLVTATSAVQLSAFAAPRSEGIWAEIRTEILAALKADSGSGEEVYGPFGQELRGRTAGPDGRLAPVRFVGIDGPRWFLRGLISGAAASDPRQAEPIEAAIRQVVVVRGDEPMAPRDPLPLRMPPTEGGPPDGGWPAGPGAGPPDLDPFERGPEITEVR